MCILLVYVHITVVSFELQFSYGNGTVLRNLDHSPNTTEGTLPYVKQTRDDASSVHDDSALFLPSNHGVCSPDTLPWGGTINECLPTLGMSRESDSPTWNVCKIRVPVKLSSNLPSDVLFARRNSNNPLNNPQIE